MKAPEGAPWAPVEYEDADIGAFKSLVLGEATEEQQRRALKFIVEEICKTYDLSYRPDSERDSAFAEGKRFVGLQIVKLTKLNLSAMRKTDGRRSNPKRPAGRSTEQPA